VNQVRDSTDKRKDEEPESMPIKREQADDGAVRGEAKKRKTQVIVLDD
jgi:hypothetical protein